MHFLKLVVGQQSLETSSLLESSEENRSFGSMNKTALLNPASSITTHTPNSSATSPSGVIGVVRGWSGASSMVKHQQSAYRPSTTPRSSSSRFADNNKLLSVFTLIGLILIFSNFTKMSGVAAMPRCPAAVETEEPGDCSYGITNDYCGRKVCAKGPGQICGVGLFKLLGSCGEGLYCNCGRCTGCSLLTMECYDKTCV